MASHGEYLEKMRGICEDTNKANEEVGTAIKKMIDHFQDLVDLRNEMRVINPVVYGTLFAASKSVTSFYKFAVSLGLKLSLNQFRKYFAIAEG